MINMFKNNELNLCIVNLQYVFSQHNNIRNINVLPQHVSTPEIHHQAEYLRTIKYTILYSTIHVTIALGIPYALH